MPMRPQISWSDLAGARVGVWGLGIEGTANLEMLISLGAEIVVVEDSPSGGLVLGHAVVPLGRGGQAALLGCEVVVKTPGVRRRRPEVAELEAAGIPVVGGLGLWMQGVDRSRVIAITGTKGKSTTTAIAGHLLERLGYRTLVAGNIGRVPYGPALAADFDYAIIEVSSFQATDLSSSPPVVAVTSLHPDHLDWHGGVEAYFRDKLSACSQPGAELTVADESSPLLREREDRLGPRVHWVVAGEESWSRALGLPGAHNRRNAAIARACLIGLGVPEARDDETMAAAAEGFGGLESRLQTIGAVSGVTFVDDGLSTNVLPTLAALDAFESARVALIVGGHDRGIDYEPLAKALAARASRAVEGNSGAVLVLTIPENGKRISEQLRPVLGSTEVIDCGGLEEAVRQGFFWAREGEVPRTERQPDGQGSTEGGHDRIVLLSPAAPSFGLFRDYRDRSAAFVNAMAELSRERSD